MTFEYGIDIAAPIVGGGTPSPADEIGRPRSLIAALRESPWAPVVLRGGAVLAGMLALAAIGMLSMAKSFEGMTLPKAALEAQMGGAWLAPTPAVAAADGGAAEPECDAKTGAEPGVGLTTDGKVILNTAGVAELTRLPGVGRRRAEDIVALRTRLKRFRRVTDLLRVRGIGVRSLKRMQPHLVLDPPAAADAGTKSGSDAG